MKKYLRKDYANLLTVDLVCHSIPSPLIYKEYLTYCSKKLKKEIVFIDMRYKKLMVGVTGTHTATVSKTAKVL